MSWRAVAVVGPGKCTEEEATLALDVGKALALAGVAVVTGGLGGVMEAASRGAFEAGGTTIGILPDQEPADANAFVNVPIATGLGELRNFLVVRAADAVIAIGGEWGTLSEIAMAMKLGKPVVGLGTWELGSPNPATQPLLKAESPDEAVKIALASLRPS